MLVNAGGTAVPPRGPSTDSSNTSRTMPLAAAQLRAPLYEDKVVDFLFAKAEVTERAVTRAEIEAAIEAEDDSGHVHGPGCGHDHGEAKPAKKAAAKKPAAKKAEAEPAAAAKPAAKKAPAKKADPKVEAVAEAKPAAKKGPGQEACGEEVIFSFPNPVCAELVEGLSFSFHS